MSTMIDLNDYQTKVLSQWGQDGVLEKIFDICPKGVLILLNIS